MGSIHQDGGIHQDWAPASSDFFLDPLGAFLVYTSFLVYTITVFCTQKVQIITVFCIHQDGGSISRVFCIHQGRFSFGNISWRVGPEGQVGALGMAILVYSALPCFPCTANRSPPAPEVAGWNLQAQKGASVPRPCWVDGDRRVDSGRRQEATCRGWLLAPELSKSRQF